MDSPGGPPPEDPLLLLLLLLEPLSDVLRRLPLLRVPSSRLFLDLLDEDVWAVELSAGEGELALLVRLEEEEVAEIVVEEVVVVEFVVAEAFVDA